MLKNGSRLEPPLENARKLAKRLNSSDPSARKHSYRDLRSLGLVGLKGLVQEYAVGDGIYEETFGKALRNFRPEDVLRELKNIRDDCYPTRRRYLDRQIELCKEFAIVSRKQRRQKALKRTLEQLNQLIGKPLDFVGEIKERFWERRAARRERKIGLCQRKSS